MEGIGKSLLFTVAIMVLSLSVFPAVARMQVGGGGDGGGGGGAGGGALRPIDGGTCNTLGIFCRGNDTAQTANNFIRNIVNAFLGLVAIIAAIFLIIGGLRYITAQGNDQALEKAKSTILYAIIGLVIVGLSAVLVNFVISAIQAA